MAGVGFLRGWECNRALAQLKEIGSMRLRTIEGIRDFQLRARSLGCGAACQEAVASTIRQVHQVFVSENAFLSSFAHANEYKHRAEHREIQKGLIGLCKGRRDGAAACGSAECVHAFDSFLVHCSSADADDYSTLDVIRRLSLRAASRWRITGRAPAMPPASD